MPTGYTADVQSGEVTSLKDFAMQLARGMGALVMMRDDPSNALIPERFEPSDYNANKLVEIQEKLATLRTMSPEQWQQEADAEYEKRMADYQEWKSERVEQRARYDAMIDKVKAWKNQPEGIKEFALSQLRESRQFDCPDGDKYYYSLDRLSGEEWKVQQEDKLMKDSAYHAKAHQEEVDRTEGRNSWLARLRKSLEGVE